jgi:hypothetical protein
MFAKAFLSQPAHFFNPGIVCARVRSGARELGVEPSPQWRVRARGRVRCEAMDHKRSAPVLDDEACLP